MNRLAYLAGIHIYHYFLNQHKIEAITIIKGNSQEQKFVHFVLESLYAYFFSKVINPHRKCEMYIDLRNQYTQEKNLDTKMALQAAIFSLDNMDLNNLFDHFQLTTLYQSALYVGHILGEYLYELVFNRGLKINFENDFLKTTPDNFSYQRIKRILLKDNPYKSHQKRYF